MSSTKTLKTSPMVGFIGGGNMAYAIASGLLNKAVLQPEQIIVSARNLENLQKRWLTIGVTQTTVSNEEVMRRANIIFICVKPQMFPAILVDFKKVTFEYSPKKLFVSIMAGVTLVRLKEDLAPLLPYSIVRAMPNTPMQVGVGCTVYARDCQEYFNVNANELYQDLQVLFEALGVAHEVEESKINAVTGLAGCGPAYVYEFIEALADGGVKQGIPRAMALQLAAQTVMGAAKTVLDTGKHPAVLKDEVCSPGGATIHGVHALERGSMRGTVMNAVEFATKRAEELS